MKEKTKTKTKILFIKKFITKRVGKSMLLPALLSVFLGGLASYHVQAAEAVSFIEKESTAEFLILNKLINKVNGEFHDFKAEASFEGEKLSGFTAVANVDSIDTGNKKRDKHLRNADFFETEKYPEITIKMLSVNANNTSMKALLSMKDVTKEVNIPYTLDKKKGNDDKDVLELVLSFAIDRRDYDVGNSFAAKIVANEVNISLTFVFSEKNPS